jgi:hypothetical protein
MHDKSQTTRRTTNEKDDASPHHARAIGTLPGDPVHRFGSNASAQAEPVIVNVENFVRAETAAQFDRIVKNAGGKSIVFFICANRRRWTSRPSSA